MELDSECMYVYINFSVNVIVCYSVFFFGYNQQVCKKFPRVLC